MKKSDKNINSDENIKKESFSGLHSFKPKSTEENRNNKDVVLKRDDKLYTEDDFIPVRKTYISEPIWLSVSEAAKLGGVQNKTIRRALKYNKLSYKIVKDRYLIDFSTVLEFLYSTKKLKNKLANSGIGQYIEKWKK